jgi:hypothetical protein
MSATPYSARSTGRLGSVMIIVLMILLITGLLAAQTFQLLARTAQGSRYRQRVLQARELAELGRWMVEQGLAPESGELALDVDGVAGKIRFLRLSSEESLDFRIVAEYGNEDSQLVVATSETRR